MTMSLTRFQQLAEAYGGDLARWPQAEQEPARTVLAADPLARAALEREGDLDVLLALDIPPTPSDLLRRRILKAAPPRRPDGFGWPSRAGWAAAAAAGLVCGVLLGDQALTGLRAEASYEQAQAWSLDEGDYFG